MHNHLQLSLDYPNRLYAPGDTIAGTVTGWDPSSKSSVYLILEGRSKSYLRFKGSFDFRYRDRSPLLYQVIQLKPASSGKSTDGRFMITIPETTQQGLSKVTDLTKKHHYWTHSWPKNEDFELDTGYALPPSMIQPKRINHGAAQDEYGWGHVRYTITAIQSEPHKKKKAKVTGSALKVVWVTTARMSMDTYEERRAEESVCKEQRLTVETLRLNPAIGNRKLSFRESFKGAFSTKPSLQFMPIVAVPKLVVAGSDTTLSVCVRAMPINSKKPDQLGYDFPLPPITLEQITLRLKETTRIRCKGNVVTSEYCSEFADAVVANQTWETKYVFYPTDDHQAYAYEPCLIDLKIPASCTPTFRTCNFRKKWYIKGDAVFSCMSENLKTSFRCDVDIISKPRRWNAVGDDHGDISGLLMVGEEEDEACPGNH
ncbi:hypothetical protein P168DRAFT_59029 [Aspergillus campestris IBT 28561]|uniref:Arrestin-like N-terminal domain-containing protein n=1 Tax=Aspergillus campestris (strain IBT 28561) TaxID=1392248 RepID=A0A2I1CTZ7_ASPC2|nr:uncharacterized protein P168DRAFT_59029 [Aspergillus campestris IBT 28561]PKY01106.1 hypothetical protein P168DRAFT_59029 [Aspergillus campestris IBT 28561]